MINLNVDLGILIIQVITFLLGMILIWQVFLKKFSKKLSERSAHIKDTLDEIAKQKIEVEALKADFQKQLETTDKKFQDKIREATTEGSEIKNDHVLRAREEAKLLLVKTGEKLEIEKEKMLKEMRIEITNLALSIAEKVLKENVGKQQQEKLVADLLKELEKK